MSLSTAAPVMVVAGEASGDAVGASLARALGELDPSVRLLGMGGTGMAAAGVRLLADVTRAAAVGWSEAAGGVPSLLRTYRDLRRAVRRTRPSVLVLIDFPEFNLRLARVARRAGVPVVYLVPPQLWAWRPWRMRAMRRRVSLVLAAFPFETALYGRAGVPVAFVGHPAVDAVAAAPGRAEARRALGLGPAEPVVALLPGSRRQEVDRMLPAMREAASRLRGRWPGARIVLALAPTVDPAQVARALEGDARIEPVSGRTHAAVRAADVALVTSGTATLEAALLGTPMVVGYRVSRLTEAMTRLLVRVPWISLVNLTLGRGVVPELLQEAASGSRLGDEAARLLANSAAAEAQRRAFAELAVLLGGPGVADRAARQVLAARRAA